MEAYISFGLTLVWITPSLHCFPLIFFGKNLSWMQLLPCIWSRSGCYICLYDPGIHTWRGGEKKKQQKPMSLAINNRAILYSVALAEEQRCHGRVELWGIIFVWVKVQTHSWKQTASKFSMLYLLFFKLPHHHFSPIRLWHPSSPQPREVRDLSTSAGGEQREPDTISQCPPRQSALISLHFEIFN